MNPTARQAPIAMHGALVEYATYDSNLLFSDFMRRVLLFVYADTAVLAYKAHAQRTLAFRLLARSDALGRRFLWLRLKGIRQTTPGRSDPARPGATPSPEVLALTRGVQQACRQETATLLRLLRQEQPGFSLENSFLSPVHFVQALEDCLSVVTLSGIERGIVFHAWAGVFCASMRSTYEKYIRVLEHRNDISWGMQQDFVDTWSPAVSFVEAAAP